MNTIILLSILFFTIGYLLNMFYITVFYHRGLAHNALEMPNSTKRLIYATGIWVTGIDPRAWVCMHRMHHNHSDTQDDPHSPTRCNGFLEMFVLQFKSYRVVVTGLLKEDPKYTSVVSDLGAEVHWLQQQNKPYLPYLLHILIALCLSFGLGFWVGFFYLIGIMSHPVQGALVNYFGHKHGYKNYKSEDDSTNNLLVALLTMGEGYQNNHHHRPCSAKFGVKWFEVDFGYWLCYFAKFLGFIRTIRK